MLSVVSPDTTLAHPLAKPIVPYSHVTRLHAVSTSVSTSVPMSVALTMARVYGMRAAARLRRQLHRGGRRCRRAGSHTGVYVAPARPASLFGGKGVRVCVGGA